jgi:hypothetical protein
MDKVEFIQIPSIEGIEETHALIEHADGSFTSMLKSTYDAMQAEQSTPIVTDEAEAK